MKVELLTPNETKEQHRILYPMEIESQYVKQCKYQGNQLQTPTISRYIFIKRKARREWRAGLLDKN